MVARGLRFTSQILLAGAVLNTGNALFAADADGDVAAELKALKARVVELEKQSNDSWMTEQRTQQIRSIVQDVLSQNKKHETEEAPTFGYNNGFFIQTSDKNFRLNIDGYAQFRYTYANNQTQHPSAFATKPKQGDASGFDFRYARLFFSGNAFTPNLTYMIMGDFAGDSGNSNDFQLVDDYIAYRFNDTFNIRAGSFLVPFSRSQYISSGLELVDFDQTLGPFDPVRSFGVSLYGEPVKDRVTYEFNINNGPSANHNGRAAQVGGNSDNRLGFASRWQFFGGTGKPSDFSDEADMRKDNSTAAWMIGTAVGYDSANQSSTAYPGKQPVTIGGVSSNDSPGFVGYPLNGDVYRATIDGELKYRGWAFTGATFFQQINENPGAGVVLPAGFANKNSFFMFGAYGQVGYMLSKQWEVAGRIGNVLTEGGPNQMQEYTIGLNYYMFGKNVKIQGDLTYVPNEAGITSSTYGTSINTQDVIARVQLQLKF